MAPCLSYDGRETQVASQFLYHFLKYTSFPHTWRNVGPSTSFLPNSTLRRVIWSIANKSHRDHVVSVVHPRRLSQLPTTNPPASNMPYTKTPRRPSTHALVDRPTVSDDHQGEDIPASLERYPDKIERDSVTRVAWHMGKNTSHLPYQSTYGTSDAPLPYPIWIPLSMPKVDAPLPYTRWMPLSMHAQDGCPFSCPRGIRSRSRKLTSTLP